MDTPLLGLQASWLKFTMLISVAFLLPLITRWDSLSKSSDSQLGHGGHFLKGPAGCLSNTLHKFPGMYIFSCYSSAQGMHAPCWLPNVCLLFRKYSRPSTTCSIFPIPLCAISPHGHVLLKVLPEPHPFSVSHLCLCYSWHPESNSHLCWPKRYLFFTGSSHMLRPFLISPSWHLPLPSVYILFLLLSYPLYGM